MNKITLVGRLTRDMEVKSLNTGSPIGTTSIAVEREYQKDYKNKVVDFFNLGIIGRGIDKRVHLFSKGTLVSVYGEVNITQKEDKTYVNVKVDNIQPLEFKKQDKEEPFQKVEEDDIPF